MRCCLPVKNYWMCIKFIKGDSKDIYNAKNAFYFKEMLFFWTFYSSNNPENKNLWQFPEKRKSSTTVFNIDNNQKCLLSSKSVYYYDFWRLCDTEDWSNDAENTPLVHLNIYSNKKKLFWIVIMPCHNCIVFTVFWSNKCSLIFAQKRLLSKT